jgi:GTP-binding protein
VVGLGPGRSFVVADVPGIIEGAHLGKGLGLKFLRHVERTRVLVVLLPLDALDLQAIYDRLRREIRLYSEALFHRPHVIVLTKRDLLPLETPLPVVRAPDALATLAISSVSRTGLDDLAHVLERLVEQERAAEQSLVAEDFLGPGG